MSIDVAALRAEFPALASGVAYFDGPGGSQVPRAVADAVSRTMTAGLSNRGHVTASERRADDVVLAARTAMADLLGADERGVVFGRSMTQLTYDLSRTLAKAWRPGDEVVVTRLDHDANIRPWVQAATAAGATLRWVDFDPATGEVATDAVAAVLGPRTRVVAVTGASNLIGTRPAVADIASIAHRHDTLVVVDGVHLSAHAPVGIAALGADLYLCSPYKFFGPHCGVLVGDPARLLDLSPDKLLPSTSAVPERFELGTLPYELLAGCTAAVDFIAAIAPSGTTRRESLVSSMTAVEQHEDALRHRLELAVESIGGITNYSRAARRTPTLLLTFDGRDAAEAYRHLAEVSVNAPAGSFYAIEASRWLGLGDAGGLRVGLAPYTDDSDVDRLVDGLRSFMAA